MAMLGSLLPLVSLLLLSLVSGLRGASSCTSMSDVMKACDLNGADVVEMEYREMLFQVETEHSNKELYQIIAQSRPVKMISY